MSPARSGDDDPKEPPADPALSKIEEILAELKRTGRPIINEADAIINTKGTKEIIKGKAQPAFITLEAPAMGNLNRLGDRRLARSVEPLGRKVNRVKKVRACVKRGTKIVFIWETDDEDNSGIEVKRSGTDATINFAELLIPEGLSLETGHYEKYALEFSEPTDTVYPALKFDMSKIIESGLTFEERKRRAVAAGEIAPKRRKKKQPEPAPEPKGEDEE